MNQNKIDSTGSQIHYELSNRSIINSTANLSLRNIHNSQGNIIATSDASDAAAPRTALNLKLGEKINFLLGKIKNAGSYPLHKQTDAQGHVYYSNRVISSADSRVDDLDPLDMLGSTYRNSMLLSNAAGQSNDDQDLQEDAATALVTQADTLNHAVYPVRIRLIFSADCDLSKNDPTDPRTQDFEIGGIGSEFCSDRLEAGESIDSRQNISHYSTTPSFSVSDQISLQAVLDQGAIRPGKGCLYISAEAVKTDNSATSSLTERDTFCSRPFTASESRQNRSDLYIVKDGDRIYDHLNDFKSLDNLIQIPIDAKAVDLIVKDAALERGTSTNWNINDALPINYTLKNNGTLDAEGASIATKVTLGNQSFTGTCNLLTQRDPLGNLSAGAESAVSRTVSFDMSCINSLALWDTIPLATNSLNITVDPTLGAGSVGNYYEANEAGNGESNNTISISGLNLVAPDLTLYAVGGTGISGCDRASCTLNTALNSTLNLDVYVKNEGTGASRPTQLHLQSSTSTCFTIPDASVPALNPGQMVRIPVTATVRNSYTECATIATPGSPGVNQVLSMKVDRACPISVKS